MRRLGQLALTGGALLVALAAADAEAGLITRDFTGNDCSGYFNDPFGNGFSACSVFVNDDGQNIAISPVIIKFEDGDEQPDEINTFFATIDGSEFDAPYTGGSGSWTYTPNDPEDPGIRYWAAKHQNFFRLHWMVDDAEQQPGGACAAPDYYNLACLNAALVVTSGTWTSPGNGRGLSHLTFYDSEPPHLVPEPATLALLGIGLLGVGYAARRRQQEA